MIRTVLFSRFAAAHVVAVALVAGIVGDAGAQHDWTGPAGVPGNWTNETYWGVNPPPTDYALIRNGGIAVINTPGIICNRTSIGSASGTDTLRVNTNGDLTGSTDIRLGGANAGDSGTLEVNGGDVTLSGSADLLVTLGAGTTGIVEVTDGSLSIGHLIMSANWHSDTASAHGGVSRFNHSGGDVVLSDQQTHVIGGGAVGERDASYIQTGGKLTAGQIMYIGNDDGSTGLYSISNAVMETSRAMYVGMEGSGRMEIHDGSLVTVSNANANLSVFNIGSAAGGDGTVEMTGGSLTLQYLKMADGGTGIFRLKGGTVKFYGYMINLVTATGGNGLFEQTGGLVDLTTTGRIYLNPVAGTTARYNISGGTIDSADYIHIYDNPDVGAFRLTGSAPSVTFQRIRNDNNTPFLLEFVLDKSLDHLAPINMTLTSAYRTGDLRVGLDGGIVLTQTNAFTVIHAAGLAASPEYTSRPDPNMWTESLVYDVNPASDDESRITLADGYKMAELDLNGPSAAGFAARAMGHVTLANINTSRMDEGLAVFLDVDAATYGKTPAELVSGLIAAGYTNSTTQVAAPYDVMTVIPKAYVQDGSAYFAWDFTDVSTGTTNATVSAVRFSTWPIKGTLITIQ